MKAGFKPKTMTKKEWQNNRASACKGSGVGKALEAWQTDCPAKLSDITKAGVAKAYKAAGALDKALDVALKKCDKVKQKETIAGIAQYKSLVSRYQKVLKLTLSALTKREELTKSLNLQKVTEDADLAKAFMVYAKKKGFFEEQFTTHLLCKKKKYAEAVKRYSNNGEAGGDYNISGKSNKILYNNFVAMVREDKKDIDNAIHELESGMVQMLSDARHYNSFANYESYLRILNGRFPLIDFSY